MENITLNALVDAIAEAIVAKLAEKGIDGPPSETEVPETNDTPAPKKRGRKKKEPEPEPEEDVEDEADEDEADEEDTTDLPTDEAKEFVSETVESTELDDVRAELQEFYVNQGHDAKEIASTIADMSEDDLKEAYTDYLARLVMVKGDELDFAPDFDNPYPCQRVNDGETVDTWAKGGVTLTEEEIEELNAAKAKPKPKRTRTPKKKK